jgi:hypothetical protein
MSGVIPSLFRVSTQTMNRGTVVVFPYARRLRAGEWLDPRRGQVPLSTVGHTAHPRCGAWRNYIAPRFGRSPNPRRDPRSAETRACGEGTDLGPDECTESECRRALLWAERVAEIAVDPAPMRSRCKAFGGVSWPAVEER